MIHMCRVCSRVRIQPGMRMLRRNNDGSIAGEETWAKLRRYGSDQHVDTGDLILHPSFSMGVEAGLCPQCEKKAIEELAREQKANA